VDRPALERWVDAYERAWRAPGTDGLGDLFTPDAVYVTAPFEEPHRGLPAIAELWEAEREGPDEVFAMTSEIVAVEGDRGVVRVEVRYGEPMHQLYRDLWIVELDSEGRCRAFEEWPFWPAGTEGTVAAGAY
jgi:ketosteroid isomerase-like protein